MMMCLNSVEDVLEIVIYGIGKVLSSEVWCYKKYSNFIMEVAIWSWFYEDVYLVMWPDLS